MKYKASACSKHYDSNDSLDWTQIKKFNKHLKHLRTQWKLQSISWVNFLFTTTKNGDDLIKLFFNVYVLWDKFTTWFNHIQCVSKAKKFYILINLFFSFSYIHSFILTFFFANYSVSLTKKNGTFVRNHSRSGGMCRWHKCSW